MRFSLVVSFDTDDPEVVKDLGDLLYTMASYAVDNVTVMANVPESEMN